jgi:predicted amidohydrolase
VPRTPDGSGSPDRLRLAVHQMAAVPREPAANAGAIAAAADAVGADVLVTPELSLTGYDLGDAVHDLARSLEIGARLRLPDLATAPGVLVVGLPERGHGGPFNSAALLRAGTVLFRHRKLYLPTYGMFDEGRWYGRGTRIDCWTHPAGWRIGILICEDFWHPALAWLLAAHGIDVLLVMAAAPGRGVRDGGEHGAFASADTWERIARTTAQLYGIHVALANRVGVEGAVTFAGGSLIAAPDGAVVARADDAGTTTLTADVTRAGLDRARRPYAHARDDDRFLVLRELHRMLGEP